MKIFLNKVIVILMLVCVLCLSGCNEIENSSNMHTSNDTYDSFDSEDNNIYSNTSENSNYNPVEDLEGTIWVPDFVTYPNNYHENNPELTLVDVSENGTKLRFMGNNGEEFLAVICSGWDNPGVYDENTFTDDLFLQYLFTNTDFYYGITMHGVTEASDKSSWPEPTIMVEVKKSGWYTVIYKQK